MLGPAHTAEDAAPAGCEQLCEPHESEDFTPPSMPKPLLPARHHFQALNAVHNDLSASFMIEIVIKD